MVRMWRTWNHAGTYNTTTFPNFKPQYQKKKKKKNLGQVEAQNKPILCLSYVQYVLGEYLLVFNII
jgi:hypothetical protein